MAMYGNRDRKMTTRNFITFAVIFIVLFLLLDRLVIAKTLYLQYLDFLEFGFELNRLADTLRLQGAVVFVGIGPFILFGTLIFYFYVRFRGEKQLGLFKSFSVFLNFFITVVSFNILGGLVYYICSKIPYISAMNEFFSNLILIRVYLNFPFIQGFDYSGSYINFSIVSLIGLWLLQVGYFKDSVQELLSFFEKIKS